MVVSRDFDDNPASASTKQTDKEKVQLLCKMGKGSSMCCAKLVKGQAYILTCTMYQGPRAVHYNIIFIGDEI